MDQDGGAEYATYITSDFMNVRDVIGNLPGALSYAMDPVIPPTLADD
jgi:hypothetical protein